MMERQAGMRMPEGWSTKMALEMRMVHGGTKQDFSMEVVGCFKSCLERQVNEAVRIASSKAKHILNSKSEFHQAPLIRQVVAHGLSGDQGEDLVVVRRRGGACGGRGGSVRVRERRRGASA